MRSIAVIAVCGALAGCTGLSREINQALPEFLRSDPGAEEMEIYSQVRKAREWSAEDLQEQDRQISEIRRLRSEGEWIESVDRIDDFLEQFPVSVHDEHVRYWLGDAHFHDDAWERAHNAWRELTALHPISDYNSVLTERLYEIGKDFLDGNRSSFFGIFSRRGVGVKVFNHLIETFPSSPRSADAQWLLARYHFDDERWAESESAFQFIVDHYDASEWYRPALYHVAYCRYRLVKGVVYDPVMKEKARVGFELYLATGSQGAWREDAQAIMAELEEMQAQQILSVANWYIGQGKPYSARYYLLSVMTRFPRSGAATRAQEMLPTVSGSDEGVNPVPPEKPGESGKQSQQ